ncbi:hypothetical protein C8Q70DRAFT_699574 [Cubamyces menziesii]|nr:hypothetical protein C8Q70DRAFT_699574 [Cubamyces menziesii]
MTPSTPTGCHVLAGRIRPTPRVPPLRATSKLPPLGDSTPLLMGTQCLAAPGTSSCTTVHQVRTRGPIAIPTVYPHHPPVRFPLYIVLQAQGLQLMASLRPQRPLVPYPVVSSSRRVRAPMHGRRRAHSRPQLRRQPSARIISFLPFLRPSPNATFSLPLDHPSHHTLMLARRVPSTIAVLLSSNKPFLHLSRCRHFGPWVISRLSPLPQKYLPGRPCGSARRPTWTRRTTSLPALPSGAEPRTSLIITYRTTAILPTPVLHERRSHLQLHSLDNQSRCVPERRQGKVASKKVAIAISLLPRCATGVRTTARTDPNKGQRRSVLALTRVSDQPRSCTARGGGLVVFAACIR